MTQRLIRFLMKLNEVVPGGLSNGGRAPQEALGDPAYLAAGPEEQRVMEARMVQAAYDEEVRTPLDDEFPGTDLSRYCAGRVLLDLGSAEGGRSMCWLERYGAQRLIGIEPNPTFVRMANRFARARGLPAEFRVGVAEALDLEDSSIDVVLSSDTMEHLPAVERALSECHRVLRPGGHLIVKFPPFYEPTAHHLDLVTRTPFLHWFFDYPSLFRAYLGIIDERGPGAAWYRPLEGRPATGERGYTINGITARAFRGAVLGRFRVVYDGFDHLAEHRPARNPLKRLMLRHAAHVLRRIPAARELFLVSYILEKP